MRIKFPVDTTRTYWLLATTAPCTCGSFIATIRCNELWTCVTNVKENNHGG